MIINTKLPHGISTINLRWSYCHNYKVKTYLHIYTIRRTNNTKILIVTAKYLIKQQKTVCAHLYKYRNAKLSMLNKEHLIQFKLVSYIIKIIAILCCQQCKSKLLQSGNVKSGLKSTLLRFFIVGIINCLIYMVSVYLNYLWARYLKFNNKLTSSPINIHLDQIPR